MFERRRPVTFGEVARECRETARDSEGAKIVGLEHLDPEDLELKRFDEGGDNTFTKSFKKGQMLFGRRRAYLKKAALAPFDGICSGDITVIEAIPEKLDPALLPFLVQNDAFFAYAIGGSAGSLSPRVKWEHLAAYTFSLPPLAEQKKLASALWAMERVKRAYKKLLAETDRLVEARFVEMFGDVIKNDKGWPSKPLGELCEIVRGGSPRPIDKYLGGTIPWIKIGDATEGDDFYIHSTREHIIEEGLSKTRVVKPGSLIFANCGVSLGFARIVTFEGCIHDGWLALNDIDEKLDKLFLLKTINYLTRYFRKIAPGSTQPNLNTEIMKRYVQILPPLSLQREFAAFVGWAEKAKESLKNALASLTAAQKAKMNGAFREGGD